MIKMYNHLLYFLILVLLKTESYTNEYLKLGKTKNKNLCVIDDNYVYLSKVEDGECGECKLKKVFAKYAKLFTKLNEGNCRSLGYNVPSGSELIIVPVVGTITIYKYKRKIIS